MVAYISKLRQTIFFFSVSYFEQGNLFVIFTHTFLPTVTKYFWFFLAFTDAIILMLLMPCFPIIIMGIN